MRILKVRRKVIVDYLVYDHKDRDFIGHELLEKAVTLKGIYDGYEYMTSEYIGVEDIILFTGEV